MSAGCVARRHGGLGRSREVIPAVVGAKAIDAAHLPDRLRLGDGQLGVRWRRFWDRGGDTQPGTRMDDGGGGGIGAFDPGSSDYKAYGRADNLTLPSLRLIFKDGSEKACLYSQLDRRPAGWLRVPPLFRGWPGKRHPAALRRA